MRVLHACSASPPDPACKSYQEATTPCLALSLHSSLDPRACLLQAMASHLSLQDLLSVRQTCSAWRVTWGAAVSTLVARVPGPDHALVPSSSRPFRPGGYPAGAFPWAKTALLQLPGGGVGPGAGAPGAVEAVYAHVDEVQHAAYNLLILPGTYTRPHPVHLRGWLLPCRTACLHGPGSLRRRHSVHWPAAPPPP